MKSLKEYLFEGIFDTPEDTTPIYNSVKNWLDINTSSQFIKKADIDIRGNKILFNTQPNTSLNFIHFKEKPDNLINFDKDNWLNNCIYATISKNCILNNRKEIDKYPFISNARIKSTNFEISILPSNITDVYIEGTNQKPRNITVNCCIPQNINIDWKNFSITLDNFKMDDANCIKINSEELCNITIRDAQIESYIEELFYELDKHTDHAIHDCEKEFLIKYKQFFNWMDNNNIKSFEIYDTFLQKNRYKISNIKIFNNGLNKKSYIKYK